jgi:hypothetical protein
MGPMTYKHWLNKETEINWHGNKQRLRLKLSVNLCDEAEQENARVSECLWNIFPKSDPLRI